MSEQVSSRQIRAFCDGELDVDEGAALQRRVGEDAELEARVRFEESLRSRVATVMANEPASAPAELRERVTRSLADTGADGAENDGVAQCRERRSWLTGPTRANVFAVVATLALITSAVLFGIFGRPIDSFRGDPVTDLVAESAHFASAEHVRCSGELRSREQKIEWTDKSVAEQALARYLGSPLSVLDLEEFGYRFTGAGTCDVPGRTVSAHLIYTLDERGDDGCPQATVSLFVVPDLGQFDTALGRKLERWEWIRAGEPPECAKRVAFSTDGKFVYLLVCCNERSLVSIADLIRRAAP